jgi:hypothetical protein
MLRYVRPVGGIELRDQFRDEMGVLRCFLHRGKARAGRLALPGILDLSIIALAIAIRSIVGLGLVLNLALQELEVPVPKRVWAQTTDLEAVGRSDMWIPLQQIGDSAEDSWFYAIGSEGLEEKQGL